VSSEGGVAEALRPRTLWLCNPGFRRVCFRRTGMEPAYSAVQSWSRSTIAARSLSMRLDIALHGRRLVTGLAARAGIQLAFLCVLEVRNAAITGAN